MTTKTIEAKFLPGDIVITPAAIKKTTPDYVVAALALHLQGKWGLVDPEDWDRNDRAVREGGRALSAYPLENDPGSFWIITDGIGQAPITTVLLPSDY
jgi:hypothetical protein